jgi:hypothetical protein
MIRWRHEGDELCDEVVRILDLKPGQDGLQKLLDRLEGQEVEEPIRRFWNEVRLLHHQMNNIDMIRYQSNRHRALLLSLPDPHPLH